MCRVLLTPVREGGIDGGPWGHKKLGLNLHGLISPALLAEVFVRMVPNWIQDLLSVWMPHAGWPFRFGPILGLLVYVLKNKSLNEPRFKRQGWAIQLQWPQFRGLSLSKR